jgi:hypothetical protein
VTTPTLAEFLLARIAEDEASTVDASEVGVQFKVRSHGNGLHDLWDDDWLGGVRVDTTRVLAECEAKRRIVEWHESWPVLVETPPEVDMGSPGDISSMTFRMSQQIAWLTTQEYRKRFGDEPPTIHVVQGQARRSRTRRQRRRPTNKPRLSASP